MRRKVWHGLTELVTRCMTGLLVAAPLLAADSLDPSDPIDNMAIEMGMACRSTDFSSPQFYFWVGKVYSRRNGEPDQHLFNVQGINPRACKLLNDADRGGRGYRSTSRELMLYLDPLSNEVISRWSNPWTGEEVDVAHMVNDPANSPPAFPLTAEGDPKAFRYQWTDMGEHLIAERTRATFRESPMGGDYQSYVGGHYHSFETSSMIVGKDSITNYDNGAPIPYLATWTRISQWLPWMKMGSRDGGIVLISSGRGSLNFSHVPQPLRGEVEDHYPQMKTAPDFDDSRPFVNSWKSLKNWIDERRKNGMKEE